MSKSPKHYSETEKLSLLRDYHQSGMSKASFCRSRGICGIVLLNKWLKKYGITKEMLPLQSEASDSDMANRSKEDYKDENAQLRKRIKELEKALEFSRLETLARDLMIDKAEEYFEIPIRKKSGAK
jgi:transposase-like protein